MRSTQPLPSRSAAGSKAASPLHVPCAPTIMPWSSASTAPSALTSTSLVSSAVPRSSSSAPAVSERAPSPSAALRTTSAAHRLKRRASRPSPGERSSPGWRRAPTHPRDRALFALLARSPNQIARHAPLLGEGCMGRLLFGPRRVAVAGPACRYGAALRLDGNLRSTPLQSRSREHDSDERRAWPAPLSCQAGVVALRSLLLRGIVPRHDGERGLRRAQVHGLVREVGRNEEKVSTSPAMT